MVEAIFYVLRTAVAWRDLPNHYGPWNSVYTRWRRWCALGLWQEIVGLLSCRATGRLRFIDGSHIKLHQFGIGLGHEEGLGAVAHRVGPCPTAVRESTVKRYRTEIAHRKLGPIPLWWHHRVMKMDLSSAPTDRWAEEEW